MYRDVIAMRDIDPSRPPHILYVDEGLMDPDEEAKYEGLDITPKSAYRDRLQLFADKEIIRLKMTDFHAEATAHMQEHPDLALIVSSLNIAVQDGGDLLLNARELTPYSTVLLIYSGNQFARQTQFVKRDIGMPIANWSHDYEPASLDHRRYADWVMNRSLFGTHCHYIIQKAFDFFIDRYFILVEKEALAAEAAERIALDEAQALEDMATLEDDTLEALALAAAQDDGNGIALPAGSKNRRETGPAFKARQAGISRPARHTLQIFNFKKALGDLNIPNMRIDTPVPGDLYSRR